MNKRKVILSVMAPIAALTATTAAVATTVSLTSCSKTGLVPAIRTFETKLNSKQESTTNYVALNNTNRPSILPNVPSATMPDYEIDANFNRDSLEQIFKDIKNNIGSIIQSDINDVILEFLSCMEHEAGETELEILEKEDNRWRDVITNVRIDKSADFTHDSFLTNRKLPLLVDVLVEKETDTRDREEIQKIKDVKLDLYVEFAGKADVLEIVSRVKKSMPNNLRKLDTDYEDILELLVGERDSKKDPFDFDFDDIFERKDSSIDEIGLLKYMSNYNDITNSNGKMFGYTFDVKAFWTSLAEQAKVNISRTTNKDLVFWAPSTALCSLFVPELQDSNAQLNTIVSNIKGKYNSFDELSKAIKSNETNNDGMVKLLKDLGIVLPNNFIPVTIAIQTKTYGTSPKQVTKLELELKDKFGNDIDFEFYSNWWK